MLNFDAGKLARGAMKELQKAEKLGGSVGEVAKNVAQGVKTVEALSDLSEKIPEPAVEMLRKLLAEAMKLAGASQGKNEALNDCIKKAQALLDGGDFSMESVAKLTAELRSFMKDAPEETNGGQETVSRAAVKESTAAAQSAPAPARAQAAEVQFSDVESGAYYYDAVQWAVQEGIASGTSDTTFSPDQNCTRAQTISFLWRAAGSPAPKGQNNPFTDVAEGVYYYNAVLWAAENGIVSGTAFQPDTAVTRAQLSTFLYRNAGSPAVKGGSTFDDVPSDAYFSQAVAWVAEQGITSGTGERTFSPDTVCTRGQIVTFLYRAKK